MEKLKKNDVVRCENRFYLIQEVIDNLRLGCRCINDGEMHVLYTNDVVLVRSYQKEKKSLRAHLYEFYDWLFSDRCDELMIRIFFKFVKFAFMFCMAASIAMLLTKLIGWL
jgi:hypothetical protein